MQIEEKQAGLAGLISFALFWTVLFVFAAMRPEYTHFNKAISELGVIGAPNAIAWNIIGFILPGILLSFCGAGLAFSIDGRKSVLWFLLVASGMGFAGTGVLPAEMNDGSFAMESSLTVGHVLMTFASAIPWLCAIFLIVRRVKLNSKWCRFRGVCILLALVSLTLNLGNVFSSVIPFLEGRPALGQRIAFAGYFGWYFAISVILVFAIPKRIQN